MIKNSKKLSENEKTIFTNECSVLLIQFGEKSSERKFTIIKAKKCDQNIETIPYVEDKKYFLDSLKKLLKVSRLIIPFNDSNRKARLIKDCLSLIEKIKQSDSLSNEEKNSLILTSRQYLKYFEHINTDLKT